MHERAPLALSRVGHHSSIDVRTLCLLTQACELFILDLTIRGWVHAEDNRRRTLQRSDIAASIANWEVLDFLVS